MGNKSEPSLGIRPRASGRTLVTRHRSFDPPAYPGWVSYASQTHVRDIDVDVGNGWIWMATWGGVLCWMPQENICIRYTSAHGLIGNATRSLAVDQSGTVWAGGQEGGLCHFSPDDGKPWQQVEGLKACVVLRLAPRPEGGVYAGLRKKDGTCALGEIAAPDQLERLEGGLKTKEIQALLVDEDQTVWIGNMWGLHRQTSAGSFVTLEGLPFPVRTLAEIGSVLWVGTDCGVHSVQSGNQKTHREPDWPNGQVVSLTVEPATGSKWLVTRQGVGRIVDNAWQPLPHVPVARLHLNELLVGKHDLRDAVPTTREFLGEHQTWAGGAGDADKGMAGLYRIGIDEYESAFDAGPDDGLSNAVQCLWADATTVWVGTARGLSCFDGLTWRNGASEGCSLRDVRAIVPGGPGELWVGSGESGFHCLGKHPAEVSCVNSIVAMATGYDGGLWAASLEQVLHRAPGAKEWESAGWPVDSPAIQVLCVTHDGLWVGTAEGLWRYRPGPRLWHPCVESKALAGLSIEALTEDPNGQLWVGTNAGLYRLCADNWIRVRDAKVRAIAFAPEGTLWLGTVAGLERWPSPGHGAVFEGPPLERFSVANSGLAADLVTALVVRASGSTRQVWIGSPAGVSRYEYTT